MTHVKNFDPRKDPRQNIFDPRNPRKNYDPRKKYFDPRNPRNPRKNLTQVTHVIYQTHFERMYFLNCPLIKFTIQTIDGLLNWDGIACCKQKTKTTDQFKLTTFPKQ